MFPPRTVVSGLILGLFIVSVDFRPPARAQQVTPDAESASPQNLVRLEQVEDGVKVFVGDDWFTQVWTKTKARPMLYPILAPGQIAMTRHWPMVKNHPEPQDHPHHKSFWLGHIINGVDFWTQANGSVLVTNVQQDSTAGKLSVKSDWVRHEGQQKICTDETVYSFGGNDQVRWIDLSIVFHASEGELHFEDTKEGTFAIRTHPNLQLTPAKVLGPKAPIGTARNSAGVKGKAIWGQKAKWLVYQGAIEGSEVAVAMFDHPQNLNHPTTWHARDYGLIAANPFGLHEFLKQPPGAGAVVVSQGDQLALRYRALFIRGTPADDAIEQWYSDFVSDR